MPTFAPLPGTVACKFSNVIRGRDVSWTIHYNDTFTAEYTPTDLNNLGTALLGVWDSTSAGIGRFSDEMGVTTLELTDLFSNTAPRVTLVGAHTGGQVAVSLPLNVAMVIQRTQDRRYRGGKSHVYLAGNVESQLGTDTDFWDATVLTAVKNDFVALDAAAFALTSSHGGHYDPVAPSYFDKHSVPAPPHLRVPPVVFLVTGNVGQSRVCSRRRRLPKLF